MPNLTLIIFYKNYRGEFAWRKIKPTKLEYTKTSWHRQTQWILFANDLDKNAQRGFAVTDIQTLYLLRR